jgi:hypothetical protein
MLAPNRYRVTAQGLSHQNRHDFSFLAADVRRAPTSVTAVGAYRLRSHRLPPCFEFLQSCTGHFAILFGVTPPAQRDRRRDDRCLSLNFPAQPAPDAPTASPLLSSQSPPAVQP